MDLILRRGWVVQPREVTRANLSRGVLHLWANDVLGRMRIIDAAGNANGAFNPASSGSEPSGARWTTGASGRYLTFDNSGTGAVTSTDIPVGDSSGSGMPGVTAFTIVGRGSVAASTNGGNAQAFYGSGSGGAGIELRVGTDLKIGFLKTATASIATGATAVTVGVDFDFAVSYDGTNALIYLNGILDGSGSSAQTFAATQHYLGFADAGGAAERLSNGSRLYHLAILQGVRSPEEIRALRGNGIWQLFAPRRVLTPAFAAAAGGVSGTAAFTLTGDSITASGTTTVKGSAAFTLAGDTITASGTTTVKSSGVFTLGSDTMTASGVVGNNVNGTAAFSLASDTMTAAGTTKVLASAAFTLTGDSIAASGTTKILSVASFTLDGVTIAAYGVSGSTSFTFPPCAIYVGGNIAIGTNGQPIVIFF